MRAAWAGVTVAAAAAVAGCGLNPLDRCESDVIDDGAVHSCIVPGWDGRPFDVIVPDDTSAPAPVVLVFHGGGGNAQAAVSITCPGGDRADPDCFDRMAARRGFVVVSPNGTGARLMRNRRTWNAGGGDDGFYCSAGRACRAGVDDIAYVDALIAEIDRLVAIDDRRIYAAGLSNGASISHRLACARPAMFAAIAPVAGPNQHAESGGACDGGTAVLQIHGTEDSCAAWDDTDDTSCSVFTLDGIKVGVSRTMDGWRVRNGCDETPVEQSIPDLDTADGSTATRVSWRGCAADVELIRVDGGGHTWPGGDQYFGVRRIGRLNRDFSASAAILDFFETHSAP